MNKRIAEEILVNEYHLVVQSLSIFVGDGYSIQMKLCFLLTTDQKKYVIKLRKIPMIIHLLK